MELIRMMLENWNQELENKQELVIEKVGKIIKESDGIFQFEQDPSVNYLPDAFGLTTIVSPAIRRPGMQDKLEKKLDRYIYAPSGKSRKLARTLKWAAMIAIPVGLAVYLSLTNMDQIRSFQENYTGFLFSNSAPVVKKTVESSKILLPSKKSINPEQKIYAIQTLPGTQVMPVVKTEAKEVSDPSAKKPFAIIVGAFRFRENADNLVAKLKQEGYDAEIFDTTTTGLFRVSVGTFLSRDKAIGQLAAVRSTKYSSAWLLSK
jgi:cell division septation protein DedD